MPTPTGSPSCRTTTAGLFDAWNAESPAESVAGGRSAMRLRRGERRLGVLRGRAFARLHEVLRRHRHCGRARRGMPYGMPLDVAASRRSAAASRLRARAGRMDVQRAGGCAGRIPEATRRAHRLGGRRLRVHARQVRDRPVAGLERCASTRAMAASAARRWTYP